MSLIELPSRPVAKLEKAKYWLLARSVANTLSAHAALGDSSAVRAAFEAVGFKHTGQLDHEQVVLFLLHQMGALDVELLTDLKVRQTSVSATNAEKKRIREANRLAVDAVMHFRVLRCTKVNTKAGV